MCLPSSCLLQLVGSASGQSSLPACLHSGKSENEEQKKMGMKPRWRGQSWGWVLEASRGLGVAVSPESPLGHFRPLAGGRGAEGGGTHFWVSPASSCPRWLWISTTEASWGLATGASAVPNDVSSGFAFEEPAARDFEGLSWPMLVSRPPLATAAFPDTLTPRWLLTTRCWSWAPQPGSDSRLC